MSAEPMTRKDRTDLAQVARMRARVVKADVEQREAALRAQVEEELSAVFAAEDERLRDVTALAREQIAKANAEIDRRCEEIGVRKEFRPSLGLSFYERGSNAVTSRRTELRMLARTRIEATGKAAKVAVDKACADTVTALIAGGLDSDEAQAFLGSMPTVEALMSAPTVDELEALSKTHQPKQRELRGY